MRVVFFSKGGWDVASSRYRCYRVAEELRQQGFDVEICDPPPRPIHRRAVSVADILELWRLHRALMRVGRPDVLYLQRPLQNRLFVLLVVLHKRLRRVKMVFDFCDPVHLRVPGRTRVLARVADVIVVSSEDLAAYARSHNGNVHVVPNSVLETEIADCPIAHSARVPVVGWVGDARVHQENLELLLEPFGQVAAMMPFVFRIVGTRHAPELIARFRRIPGMEVDAVEWIDPSRVCEVIRTFDVAILPLVDSEWQRKLVTKLVEYLAAGVPVIASLVGENRFILADGISGSLASTSEEWTTKLLAMLRAPDLRKSLAANGLHVIHDRFRLDRNAAKIGQILLKLAVPSSSG